MSANFPAISAECYTVWSCSTIGGSSLHATKSYLCNIHSCEMKLFVWVTNELGHHLSALALFHTQFFVPLLKKKSLIWVAPDSNFKVNGFRNGFIAIVHIFKGDTHCSILYFRSCIALLQYQWRLYNYWCTSRFVVDILKVIRAEFTCLCIIYLL